MFGDYNLSRSEKDWMKICDIGKVVTGSTPKTSESEYWDGDKKWITPAELQDDDIYIADTERKITEEGVDSCSLCELPKGTVLLSSRAPIGKVAITSVPMYCNQGFKNIICNEELIRPRYLYEVLYLNKGYLNSLGRGATFKEISKKIVENICIPVPKLQDQNHYVKFCSKVDKSKVAVQKSLDEMQVLFDALMQKYFG
jgi:type I restriction enzyme S subunit